MRRILASSIVTAFISGCAASPENASDKASQDGTITAATTAPTAATGPADWPAVFTDKRDLKAFGLTLGFWGGGPQVAEFGNRCYYYGDGGLPITVSDELLSIYRAQGFSLRTACLAMMSGIKYSPETGERLPTVMIIDAEAIQSFGWPGEAGSVSPEIPVRLPACFRNGTPIGDCELNYNMQSGERMDPRMRSALVSLEQQTRRAVQQALAAGDYARECSSDESGQDRCRVEIYPDTPDNIHIKGFHGREMVDGLEYPIYVVDVSPVFDAGFAYSPFADGAAGPSANLDDESLVVDKKRRASRARIESLKIAIR